MVKTALRNYEGRVIKYAHMLIKQLSAFAGQPVNATLWMAFYGFDVMGDLAFGRPFDMLESGKKHFALKLMHEGQAGLGFLGPVPWLSPILIRIPGLMKGYETWVKWSEQQVEDRKRVSDSDSRTRSLSKEFADLLCQIADAGGRT